jgi:hypothetical protein
LCDSLSLLPRRSITERQSGIAKEFQSGGDERIIRTPLRSNCRFNARRNERNSPEVALTKMAGRSVIASSDSGLAAFCTREEKMSFRGFDPAT